MLHTAKTQPANRGRLASREIRMADQLVAAAASLISSDRKGALRRYSRRRRIAANIAKLPELIQGSRN